MRDIYNCTCREAGGMHIIIIGILKEDMKGSFFRKIYTGEVRYPKEMPKNSIAPSLLSTKVSTKKKSDVSRNVRRMRSERVNLFFVSLSLFA